MLAKSTAPITSASCSSRRRGNQARIARGPKPNDPAGDTDADAADTEVDATRGAGNPTGMSMAASRACAEKSRATALTLGITIEETPEQLGILEPSEKIRKQS